jgi:hypothetical protein
MLASDVITRVQRQFGDEASVQINEEDIIRYINDACREIALQNDLTQATGTMNSVVGTTIYAFPSDLLNVRTIYYDNHKLRFFKKTEYDEYINETDPDEEQTGTPWLFTRWGTNFQLYPKPDSVQEIKLLYLQRPVAVVAGVDLLPLSDEYFSRIVEYCLQQAYQTDEDWEAAGQMAGQFTDGLMRLKEHETVQTTEYYPSITVLPEDSGY